jgi:hypothetical protein
MNIEANVVEKIQHIIARMTIKANLNNPPL